MLSDHRLRTSSGIHDARHGPAVRKGGFRSDGRKLEAAPFDKFPVGGRRRDRNAMTPREELSTAGDPDGQATRVFTAWMNGHVFEAFLRRGLTDSGEMERLDGVRAHLRSADSRRLDDALDGVTELLRTMFPGVIPRGAHPRHRATSRGG